MLRIPLTRGVLAARPAMHAYRIARPFRPIARFESNQSTNPEEPLDPKAALKAKDDLRRDWDARVLTYEEIKPRSQQPSPNTYIIDVREPDEVLQGSIPSSVNIPLSELSGSLHLREDIFRQKFGFDKPQKDQELVFYCRSGKRAATACDVAKRNGYTNTFNYEGSWLDWIERESKKSA